MAKSITMWTMVKTTHDNPGEVLAVDPAIAARADLAAIINECNKVQRYNNNKQTVGLAVRVCV